MRRGKSGLLTARGGCVVLVLLALPVLLTACGGSPSRSSDASAERSKTGRKPVVQKRGGGYYKDDGPGDEIPDNLDDIPDAQPMLEPLHRFANRPYVVLGKAYQPRTSLAAHQERGIASWYGKKFHGQKTSIGERYDMFAMTAAHPTLAIPSYVRVTNVSNGKSVVVRVIDRGPFHADRVIDLSYAAAYRLGYVDNGSTLVQVDAIVPDGATTMTYAQVMPAPTPVPRPRQVLPPSGERDEIELLAANMGFEAVAVASPPPEPESAPRVERPAPVASPAAPLPVMPAVLPGVFLQLGAFASAENAESLRVHLLRELDWLDEGIEINAGGGMHRVHMGPYRSRVDAERVAERIRLALGYKPTFITR
jgi:rare lipoprotein A